MNKEILLPPLTLADAFRVQDIVQASMFDETDQDVQGRSATLTQMGM